MPWLSSTKPPTVTGVHWTYTLNPKVVVVTKDNTRNPVVKTYLQSDTPGSDGLLTICSDVKFFGPSSPVTNITSTRNSGGQNPDTFAPTSGTPGQAGYFQTKMKTTKSDGSVAVKGTFSGLPLTSPIFSLLPAVCSDQYFTTLYFTPQETGFKAGQGWKMKEINVPGLQEKHNTSFLEWVVVEGVGRIKAPSYVNGVAKNYIRYDDDSKTYEYIDYPIGKTIASGPIRLQPKRSCAIPKNTFPFTSELITEDKVIQQYYGNQSFSADDRGSKIKAGHLDLYWGDADPKPGSSYECTVSYPGTPKGTVLFNRYPNR